MPHSLDVKLQFDLKTIRIALALISGEIFTDEQILEKYVNIDPITIDCETEMGNADSLEICLGFVAIIESRTEPKEEPKISKFQQKLQDAIEKSKNSKT